MDISPPHAYLKSIFRGVKTCTNVELINLTLLEADFKWLPPTGSDVSWIDVSVTPPSGQLRGHERTTVQISLIASKQQTIQDFRIPCLVDGMPDQLECVIHGDVQGLTVLVNSAIEQMTLSSNTQLELTMPLTATASKSCKSIEGQPISFGEDVGLYAPVQRWIEIVNPTPMVAELTTRMVNFGLLTQIKLSNSYCPHLSIGNEISARSQDTVETTKTERLDGVEEKPERRLLYDWCRTFLSNSRGACIFVHTAMTSEDGIYYKSVSKGSNRVFEPVSSWMIPAFGRLRLCLVCVADLWGAYKDCVELIARSVSGRRHLDPEPPTVNLPVQFTVIGCPILLTATSPFGQITNSVGRKLRSLSQTMEFLERDLVISAFTEQAKRLNVRFGDRFIGSSSVNRTVRLHNSSNQ
ncbi:uncharacterized protein DEA37_0013769, partial [Paragonimus westermani]